MPVYILREEMPYSEFVRWQVYLAKRPVEWRDDDRFFKILQALGYKGKPWQLFPALDSIYNDKHNRDRETINIRSLKASSMFSHMMAAKGGDEVNFDELE